MKKMKVAQVAKPNAALEVVERDIPEPKAHEVRIKVQACGVCHSDMFTVAGAFPGIKYPRVPGHEVIGIIDAVGADVPDWKAGARVGVGWHGGHCGHCTSCRRGDFITCKEGKDSRNFLRWRIRGVHDRAVRGLGLGSRRTQSRRCRTLAVRRHHDIQCVAPWRCASRGSRRHFGSGWIGTPRCAIRGKDGLQDGGHRPRRGQGSACQKARRAHLYRQHLTESRRGIDQARRRENDSRHRDGLQDHDPRFWEAWASTAS